MANITLQGVYSEREPLLEKETKVRSNKFCLEIALLVVLFGYNLSMAIFPSVLLKQMCTIKGFKTSDCLKQNGNNTSKEIEEHIQPFVAEILTTMKIIVPDVCPRLDELIFGAMD